MSGSFGAIDWAVVGVLLLVTTWVGHQAAGKQSTLKDFFLGGRRLPWFAVAASIIATEISAVTFISLPSVVQREGGNWTYLQIGLFGSLFARGLIAWFLVPAYYEREVFSPYDYMGRKLGEGARRTATALFTLGGVLGQSARVYLTALVLEILLKDELAWAAAQTGLSTLSIAVGVIVCVAMAWTLMGGIATVIWTDVVLFLLFFAGIGAALWTVSGAVDGGVTGALKLGWQEGKMKLFDLSFDFGTPYTLWAAVIASTWGGVAFYGTDQLLAQRVLCCRDVRDARKALLASYASMIITVLVAVVGVGLWAYYREHSMSEFAKGLYEKEPDKVFPIFVVEAIPTGLKGLVVAGALAAAISSLDSIVAALSQTTLSIFKRGAETDKDLTRSRGLVVFWSIVLGLAALGIALLADSYDSILDLALAMASYTGGALLAGFLLAILPLRTDASGFPLAASLSVLAVFAVSTHQAWGAELGMAPELLVGILSGALLLLGCLFIARRGTSPLRLARALFALGLGCLGVWWIAAYGSLPPLEGEEGVRAIAWPWWIPIGSTIAFCWTLLLSGPPSDDALAEA